jgi:hypothetical protein
MMSANGFSANSLAHTLQSSGLSFDNIQSAEFMLYSRQRGEFFRLDVNRRGGFQMRRAHSNTSARLKTLALGQSSTTLALTNSSSPPALTDSSNTGGQIVTFSPTETFQLVAYHVQTNDEDMNGVNANFDT